MLGLKLNHVSKRGHWGQDNIQTKQRMFLKDDQTHVMTATQTVSKTAFPHLSIFQLVLREQGIPMILSANKQECQDHMHKIINENDEKIGPCFNIGNVYV